ncbi:hypothetical protein [Flavobacterium pectinovorum]|uniref:Tetratricopeptide repeat protein n=1 Tax=Flavobacterium pectinovorum TaxID=29533 RepID=A0AB36P4A8_9FLAO|nr:hypothetical protein [Flavobacterium pectinovorum]OXB06795.1 hypothetical protein B0A72_04800 [Flavobacterium pectinovorum]SHL46523.1 hypothetical protein SAMN05444387_0671 [Flavobacterium pectinovorum]
MEPKIYPAIMRVFSSLLFFLSLQVSFACGWSVSPETSRLVLFKAQREGFFKLTPFYYSADYYYSTNTVSGVDQELNCLEWQKKLGNKINPKDVHTILYETDAEQFENAFESKSLKKAFEKNTFIEALLLPKNKVFLNYILFAKKLEYNSNIDVKWESWEQVGYNSKDHKLADLEDFEKKIKTAKDPFLKQRYAFLILRYSFYAQDKNEVIRLYDTYFAENKNTILQPWALYYKALCIDDLPLQNYLLSKVFATCEEKSFAVLQHYNWKLTAETLALVQNNEERSVILSIESFRNPAPDLKTIKEVYELSPNSLNLSFLIGREINKLEDWIFTPQYTTNGSPSVVFEGTDWYGDYVNAKNENFNKDILYLRELEYFLIAIREQTSGEQKEYITAAIAQLCFMDDDIELGKKYTNMISDKANLSIQMQKNIQLALVSLKQDDLKNETVQNQLFKYFDSVENLIETDNGLFKNLYSLYRIASGEFYKKNDRVTAGLLMMKSDLKNEGEYSGYYNTPYFYNYIGYFERTATVEDVDKLIALQQKEDKTPFEKYICSGTIAPNIDYYKDLKGTIAFRNNDLELAYETFSSMPKDFWEKNYSFTDFLNENPFTPKILQKQEERKFDYRFNKAEFIAKLIQLKKQNTASGNLQLANAYFNVSYLGNSWMMVAYDWTSGESYVDYVYGDNSEKEKTYQKGNYYSLTMAKMYYEKALKMSKNKNEKALASLMIFECNYYNHYANIISAEEEEKNPFKAGKELVDFYSLYKTTPTFKKYNCPLLQSFIN